MFVLGNLLIFAEFTTSFRWSVSALNPSYKSSTQSPEFILSAQSSIFANGSSAAKMHAELEMGDLFLEWLPVCHVQRASQSITNSNQRNRLENQSSVMPLCPNPSGLGTDIAEGPKSVKVGWNWVQTVK